jgi:hypothetical protein
MIVNNKFDLDLIFLYKAPLNREYMILDNDKEFHEWTNKYERQENIFVNYISNCPLNDLIYLLIRTFTMKYPNFTTLGFTLGNSNWDKKEENFTIFENFIRRDIKTFFSELYLGPIKDQLHPEIREIYDKKITMEFKESFSENIINEALTGKIFTKTIDGNKSIYKVEESPIDSLEYTDKKITINVNPLYIFLYYKL